MTQNGMEGTITVSANPSPASGVKVYAGNSKQAVYGLKVQASGSDMDVQRVTLQFTQQPQSYFTNIYLYDGSTQLASLPLNSTTVSKVAAGDYEITLSNFASKFIVSKDSYKVMTVQVDVVPSLGTDVLGSGTFVSVSIITPSNGVRAVDQSGLNQYSQDTTGRVVSVNASQAANAALVFSTDTNTPLSHNVISDNSGSINGATLMTFDIQAQKDAITLDNLNIQFTDGTGLPANFRVPTTAYIYDSTGNAIGTATPAIHGAANAGVAQFTSLDHTIPADTTQVFTIRIDDTIDTTAAAGANDGAKYGVTVAPTTIVNSPVSAGYILAEKSNGTTLAATSVTGSATANAAYAYFYGPTFTLSSIQTSSTAKTQGVEPSITATFNVVVAAPSAGAIFVPKTGAFVIHPAFNGTDTGTSTTAVTYSQPSGTSTGTNGYGISASNNATFVVTATFQMPGSGGTGSGNYDLRMTQINWARSDAHVLDALQNSVYMNGQSQFISGVQYLQQ